MVVPISEGVHDYAQEVRSRLRKERFHVQIDLSNTTVPRKVREAQLNKFNYILVRLRSSGRCHCLEPGLGRLSMSSSRVAAVDPCMKSSL